MDVDFINPALNLRCKIKAYKSRIHEIQAYLQEKPHEWGRFQSKFNQEVNGIFRDLMVFEKENLALGREDRVYKLKRIFVNRFRQLFAVGHYLKWSLDKPRGYAGDYKIIDDIYANAPNSTGVERLYDNYFQMSTICNAVRNRKEDFKQIILGFIENNKLAAAKIMDLASGPCRDVYEIFQNPLASSRQINFHCFEQDPHAIEDSTRLLNADPRVVFVRQNAVRLALKKDIEKSMEGGYDIIFSTGLFDYLDYRISVRLIANLKKLLRPGGILAISDVRDKFSNPSLYFMEWVADWNLIYREDDNFRSVFLEAGFPAESLTFKYEQQGVMQYIVAQAPIR